MQKSHLKIIFILHIVFAGFCARAQEKDGFLSNVTYGVGLGYVKDGWGDFSGHMMQFDMDKSLGKWSSLTARIMPTIIQENNELGNGYSFIKKSNGVNLDLDYNFHVRFWRLDFFPSAGISTRFADNQHIRSSSVLSGPNGVIEADADYHKEFSVNPGWVIGLNFQTLITNRVLIGARLSGMNYFEYQYWSAGATLRFRKRT